MVRLGDIVQNTSKIKWKEQKGDSQFVYIDLSSVDLDNHKINNVQFITKSTAPSRAQQIVEKNDVLFATTRPMQKRNCIVPAEYDSQICSTGYCVLRPQENIVLSEWLYYITSYYHFYEYVESKQEGTSYPSISDKNVKDFIVPLPSIEKQQEIVSILDRFDSLCNDLTSGLPAEIEARQKQYEYYRDKLLSFKKKEV